MSLSEKVNSSKLPENQIHESTQEKNPTHFQMPTNTSALSTYDRLIHSNNTTEEVVKIGGMIQQDFFNLTNATSLGGGGVFLQPVIRGTGKHHFYLTVLDSFHTYFL
ncbi:hypothetical protein [Chlamydia gallinacea]|uniref:hypothetical protein n=1 Tax=Chlamydia gallinacea TaxID=1457153 RepID=UPI00255D1045|nr:hypothetical protein [Chlamydia gallinacea]